MSEMVERVAAAICCGGNGCAARDGTAGFEVCQAASYRRDAIAAIAAMLEPTETMLKAACPSLRNYIEAVPKEERERLWGKPRPHRGYRIPDKMKHAARYRAMISVALAEGPTRPTPSPEPHA